MAAMAKAAGAKGSDVVAMVEEARVADRAMEMWVAVARVARATPGGVKTMGLMVEEAMAAGAKAAGRREATVEVAKAQVDREVAGTTQLANCIKVSVYVWCSPAFTLIFN